MFVGLSLPLADSPHLGFGSLLSQLLPELLL